MRSLIRRILHNLNIPGHPVSKFRTDQERFDDADQFRAELKARNL